MVKFTSKQKKKARYNANPKGNAIKEEKVMTANKETIDKKCCFYASDFHLEMTIVPYINRKIEENKNIVIVTENKLEDTVKILISRMNIKNKNLISKLDWNNSDVMQIIGKDNLVIIINGSKKFIQNKNRQINQMSDKSDIELIDCYFFEEVKEELVEIRDDYRGVLNNLQKDY